jgi:cytochrome P450
MGVAALGVELNQMSSESSTTTNFHDGYQLLLNPPIFAALVTLFNSFVPIRWLPLKENRQYNEARTEIHSMLLQVIRTRVKDRDAIGKAYSNETKGRSDILTFMLEENSFGLSGWTENEVRDHVS